MSRSMKGEEEKLRVIQRRDPLTARVVGAPAVRLNSQDKIDKRKNNVEGPREDDAADTPEEWAFVSATTITTRFENPDDATLYVDVVTQDSVTLRKPDGNTVKLFLA